MDFISTAISDVVRIQPIVYKDQRGYFFESFKQSEFEQAGLPTEFVQDNQAFSEKDVLRGLHYQLNYPQGKLVSVPLGRVLDVAVDIRRASPTFGQWVAAELSEENHEMLYIPPGFAHGYCVLSRVALFQYKCTEIYHPEDEYGVCWNDPELNIDWQIDTPVISEKDQSQPLLNDINTNLLPKRMLNA
ncbi:MAG: dTDP-4-dehydrorhamnose 3,5-epimerase [FCB group bacterium]|nr:dTDP-4-dehydrorhamnose 3,5-epimerase [FCB group bacterium]